MTTHRKLIAERRKIEDERHASRAADKAAKPAEKKAAKLRVVEPVVVKSERSWNLPLTFDEAVVMLFECGVDPVNADAFVGDYGFEARVIFESDVRTWAEGRR